MKNQDSVIGQCFRLKYLTDHFIAIHKVDTMVVGIGLKLRGVNFFTGRVYNGDYFTDTLCTLETCEIDFDHGPVDLKSVTQ